MKAHTHFLSFTAAAALLATMSVNAATTFITNNTANKTLASNESDGAALSGAVASTVTTLTLSADDGGGTINLTTVGVFNGATTQALGMDGDSMGVTNDRWGNTNQRWFFSFDQPVSFDALGFFGGNHGMILRSAAWKDDTVTNGSNWTFTTDGDFGTISFNVNNGPVFDFTDAGLSTAAAGTEFEINYISGSGGAQMSSFTITAIPEPATALLGGLGLLALLRRRR